MSTSAPDPSKDPEEYPRDLSKYDYSHHFQKKFADPRRYLTTGVIEQAILTGKRVSSVGETVAFVTDMVGVEYYVIVKAREDGEYEYITAYPILRNKFRARESGIWSSSQLIHIREMNRMKYNSQSHETPFTRWYEESPLDWVEVTKR